jgi:hypothetical protein
MPDLSIPSNYTTLAAWVAGWLLVIGMISVRATDAVLDFWTTKLRARYGAGDPRATISEPDQRLVSVYLVPPAVTVILYLLGLILGWVQFSVPWLALLFILAVCAIGGKSMVYAPKEKIALAPEGQ